jgi:general secretion pathway protein D
MAGRYLLNVRSGFSTGVTVGLMALLVLVGGATPTYAQPPAGRPDAAPIAPQSARPLGGGARVEVDIAFEQVEVKVVAEQLLGDALGLNYIVEPNVAAQISLRLSGLMRRDEILRAFDRSLAMQGLALVMRGEVYYVLSSAKAKEIGAVLYDWRQNQTTPMAPGYGAVAITLKAMKPSEIGKIVSAIAPLVSVASANDEDGSLVLMGPTAELRPAVDVARSLDQSPSLAKSKVLKLNIADAERLVSEMTPIMGRVLGAHVELTALKRLNAVLINSRDPSALGRAEEWLKLLDSPDSINPSLATFVYQPVSADVVDLASLAEQVLGAKTAEPAEPGKAVAAQQGGRVVSYPKTNRLIIRASREEWPALKSVLEAVDKPRAQIAISATIVEVALRGEFSQGVNWELLGTQGSAVVSTRPDGRVAPVLPGLAATLVNGDLKAVLSMLSSKSSVRIVANPRLMALDGETSSLRVGDEVPIVTQTAQSTAGGGPAPLVSTVSYRESGVKLSVAPRISGASTITMNVIQEVSNVTRTTTSGIDSPTFQQRVIETKLAVLSGDTIAIGGLISENKNTNRTGIPGLIDVPGVGALFGERRRAELRTELIIFLTPTIVEQGPSKASPISNGFVSSEVKALAPP